MKRKLFSVLLAVLMVLSTAAFAIPAFAAPKLPTTIYDWDKAMQENTYNGYSVPLRRWMYPGEKTTIRITKETSRKENVSIQWYAVPRDSAYADQLHFHDVNPKNITLKPGNYSKSHLKMKTNGAECTVTALKANMKKSKKHYYGGDRVVAYIRTYDSNHKLTSSFTIMTDIAIYNK